MGNGALFQLQDVLLVSGVHANTMRTASWIAQEASTVTVVLVSQARCVKQVSSGFLRNTSRSILHLVATTVYVRWEQC